MRAMKFKGVLLWCAVAALVALAYRRWGWPGVALASGFLTMWVLLYVTRLMAVVRRAAQRPRGWIESAVMFNAQLSTGRSVMRVTAQAQSLGEPLEASPDALERLRWHDDSDAAVICAFRHGKLVDWQLERPTADTD